jgi:tape measure domain-containing protein
MSEFIDALSPNFLERLKTANAEIVTMVTNVKEVNKNLIGAKTPSGSDSALKALTAEYKKQEKAIKKLQEQLIKLNEQKKTTNARTSEEIVNQSQLRRNADLQAKSTSNLVGAYQRLSAQVAIASQRYQDIIARGRLATQTQRQYDQELRVAQREFTNLQNRVLQADRAVQRFNRNVGNYPKLISGITSLMSAFGIAGGLTLFAQLAMDTFKLTKELQGLNKAMLLVTGSQTVFLQEQEFLSKIANDFGIELVNLTRLYTQFYVSAKDKLSSQEIQDIFRSISKASASMGLSVQQQERAFLALNQMMSKGTVMAEELRGQLAEALPGAFGIMAKAIGVTEQELGKMMQRGELLASDVLPKFARQLEKTYGIETINRIENITSAQNRLGNSFTELVNVFTSGEGAISKVFIGFMDFVNLSINNIRTLLGLINSYLPKTEKQTNLLERQKGIKEAEIKINSKLEVQQDKLNKLQKEYQSLLRFKGVKGYDKLIADKEKEIKLQKELVSLNQQGRLNIAQSLKSESVTRIEQLKSEIGALLIVINGEKANDTAKKQAKTTLKELNKEISFYYGQLEFANSVLNENTKKENKKTEATKKETTAIKEKNTVVQKERELIVGSVEWLEKEISALKEKQSQMSTTTEEYQKHEAEIKTLTGSLDILVGKYKELDKSLKGVGVTISEFDLSDAGIEKWLDEMAEGFQKPLGDDEKWKEDFANWSQVALDAIQVVRDAQTQQTESYLNDLERQRNIDILFAGESASAREEIERLYDEKRRQILNRQARQEKAFAITQSIINTAQGVVSALAMTPPNVPLSIAIGVIGAAQTALIASQQIPQFYKGVENSQYEGWAIKDEQGAEVHLDKKGNIKDMGQSKGAKYAYVEKGDTILTAPQSLAFNKELNSILSNNGISGSSTIVNNNLDLSPLRSDIRSLERTIKNKTETQTTFDRHGFSVYQKEQGKRALLVSNRLRIKG